MTNRAPGVTAAPGESSATVKLSTNGLGDIKGDFPQEDFWTGIASGQPVIHPACYAIVSVIAVNNRQHAFAWSGRSNIIKAAKQLPGAPWPVKTSGPGRRMPHG